MTKPRLVWSRILAAVAVLALGRPPCFGDVCCGANHAPGGTKEAESAASKTKTGSCCRTKTDRVAPPASAPAPAAEECPCCSSSPSQQLPTRAESRAGDERNVAEDLPPTAYPPLPPAVVPRLGGEPHVPTPGKTPLYLRLGRLRN